jgi:hypothetical protein
MCARVSSDQECRDKWMSIYEKLRKVDEEEDTAKSGERVETGLPYAPITRPLHKRSMDMV